MTREYFDLQNKEYSIDGLFGQSVLIFRLQLQAIVYFMGFAINALWQ